MFIMVFVHIVSVEEVKHIFQVHCSCTQTDLLEERSTIELGRRIKIFTEIDLSYLVFALVEVVVLLHSISFFFFILNKKFGEEVRKHEMMCKEIELWRVKMGGDVIALLSFGGK